MIFSSCTSSALRGLRGAVVVGCCAALTLSAAAGAEAATAPSAGVARLAPSSKLGPVSHLAVSITKPGAYQLDATWDALAGASSYQVKLTGSGGQVLAGATVTQARWTATAPMTAGTAVKTEVVPLAGNRRGRAASVTTQVPDLTAPTGTFAVSRVDRTATVTQTALSDDVSGPGAIVREVDWDQGAGFEPWSAGTSVQHTYPAGKHAYHPKVRLADAAGNSAVLSLAGVAIDDTDAPTGAFEVDRTSAWSGFTSVSMLQTGAVWDDVSAPTDVARTVVWGDGASGPWAPGTGATHVYAAPGSYRPSVVLVDEAGRSTTVAASTVVVSADTVAPKVTLSKPATQRTAVRSWVTLHGKATDSPGTGVRLVVVRVVEKRTTGWYAFKAPAQAWVPAATKAGALRKSRPAKVVPSGDTWAYRLPGLRKGRLLVKLKGRDNVGNVSGLRAYEQLLTRS
jgi:hypothetical protein